MSSINIANIVMGNLKDTYNGLDDEGKEMFIFATTNLTDLMIKLSGTEDEDERAEIEDDIRHLRSILNSLVGIGQIKLYNTVVNVIGDILAATIKSALVL